MNWNKVIDEVLNNPSISFREGHAILIREQTKMLKQYFTFLYNNTEAKQKGYSMDSVGLSYSEILQALEKYDKNDQIV